MPIALTVIMICFNGSLIEARTAIVPAKDGFWYKLQQQARDDPMCNKMRLCSSLYVQANGSVWWDAESIKTPNDMLDTEYCIFYIERMPPALQKRSTMFYFLIYI